MSLEEKYKLLEVRLAQALELIAQLQERIGQLEAQLSARECSISPWLILLRQTARTE